MSKEEIRKLGEESLEKEKEIIKKIIVSSAIADEITSEDALNELKVQYIRTNQAVREYFDAQEDYDWEDGMFGTLIRECFEYKELVDQKEKANKTQSIEDALSYSRKNIEFSYHNNHACELLKMILWYFENEEVFVEEIDEILDAFLKDSNNVISLRNLFAGNNLGVEIEKRELEIPNHKEFLHALMKMDITHQFFMKSIDVTLSLKNKEKLKEVISSSILYLTILLATHINECKKYGIDISDLSYIEDSMEDIQKPYLKVPGVENYVEYLEAFNKTIERARSLSDKVLTENTK